MDYENGMGVCVGRLREDSVYDWKFVGLSHNTVRCGRRGALRGTVKGAGVYYGKIKTGKLVLPARIHKTRLNPQGGT